MPLPISRSKPSIAEATPRDAGGENDGPRPDDVVAIEADLTRCRIDAGDRARDQYLRPEPPCLLQRAARKLVARDAAGEAEIVLDARRRPGLASGRLALDHQRAQSLGRAVHGRREAGRPAADDDGVVLGKTCARLQAKALGEVARRGSTEQRPVGQPQHRAIVVRRASPGPARRQFRRIGRHPVIGDLVAREELAQRAAGGVPAVADHRHARLGRLGRDALQPADALARERADLHGDLRATSPQWRSTACGSTRKTREGSDAR